MNKLCLLRATGATLALALCTAHTDAATALSASNFVEVGDSVSQVLDTSGLAFATMMIGSAAARADVERVISTPPGATRRLARPLSVETRCPGGGGVTMDVLDADAGGDLSVGDRFKLDFRACAVAGNTVDGRCEFVVGAHRFEGSAEITELTFRFDALGNTQMRWTGAADAALRRDLLRGTESYVVTYRDLAVTRGSHAMRWRFSIETVRPPIGEQLSRVNGAMTVDGLPLQLRQDEPFVIGNDGHPLSGLITASDRRGARLQIEARRRRYDYRLFRAGNAGDTADSVSESKPYANR